MNFQQNIVLISLPGDTGDVKFRFSSLNPETWLQETYNLTSGTLNPLVHFKLGTPVTLNF